MGGLAEVCQLAGRRNLSNGFDNCRSGGMKILQGGGRDHGDGIEGAQGRRSRLVSLSAARVDPSLCSSQLAYHDDDVRCSASSMKMSLCMSR